MSKVRRCRFGQSRKYLRPINFACYQIMNRCYWGFHLILLVVDLGSHLLDHVIDQIIEFHTHNLSESHTLLSLQALRLCISSSLVLLLTSNEGEPKLAWHAPAPCDQASVHLWAPRHWLETLAWPQLSIRSRGWPGSGPGLRAAISLLSITTLPISVMVNSKQIQASTLTGSNTFLLLCCINSCHPIISGDDGWWRLYWIRFREGEGRRAVLSVLLLWYSEAPSLSDGGDHWCWGIIMCGAMLRLLALTSDNVKTCDRCWPRPRGPGL